MNHSEALESKGVSEINRPGRTGGDEARRLLSSSSSAGKGYEDLAEKSFPEGEDGMNPDVRLRHSYGESLARLGGMVLFWACATLMALKREEWEWWQTLKSRLR